MNYVTDGATYKCPGGSTFCAKALGTQSNGEGKKLLTAVALLNVQQPAPSCKLLPPAGTAPPPPCPVVTVPTPWSALDKNTAGGAKLLTDSSAKMCPIPITGAKITLDNNPNKRVQDGASAVSIADIAFPVLAAVADAVKTAAKQTPAAPPKAQAKRAPQPPKKTEQKQENATATAKQTTVAGAAKTDGEKVWQKGPLCPGCWRKQGEEACGYPTASAQVTENSAQELRKAYEQFTDAEKDAYDRYYDDLAARWAFLEQEFGKRWSYAAHHIISGNQVFGTVPEIVQLAHFYAYDINNAHNCIFLVTKPEGRLAEEDVLKRATAYEAMGLTKMQWHVGGHSYKLDRDTDALRERIRKKAKQEPAPGPIKNYVQLVQAQLLALRDWLAEHPVCRKSDAQKQAFFDAMNDIAASTKAKLAAFCESPEKSYPYYVSKEAFYYAFALPRAVRLGVLRGSEDGKRVTVTTCRATRFQATERDADGQALEFQWSPDVQEKSLPLSEADMRDILCCVGNAQSFVVIDGDALPDDLLDALEITEANACALTDDAPWPTSTPMMFVAYDDAILAWLRDQPEHAYESPRQVAVRRIRAWESRKGGDAV